MAQVHLTPTQRALLPDAAPMAPAKGQGPAGGADFRALLNQQLERSEGVRFSKHALERLERRNIQLTPDHLERLDDAVERAKAKGARESLILMDDLAFIVSVRNQTVITATNAEHRKDNVFTNIDSAVIA